MAVLGSTAAGSGGGMYLGPASRATVSSVFASGNSATDGGFASLAALPPAAAAFSNCTVVRNAAAFSAGGFLYSGAAALSLRDSTVSYNTAVFGGAAALRRLGAPAWLANFSGLTISGNRAFAGGIVAVVDSAVPAAFFPACAPCVAVNNTAASYGPSLASIPGNYSLRATPAAKPGGLVNLSVGLTDGVGTAVQEYTNLLARVDCVGKFLPTRPGGGAVGEMQTCPLGTLQGDGSNFFGAGAADIQGVQVRGVPGSVLLLRVSLISLSGYPLDGNPYPQANVTVLGCGCAAPLRHCATAPPAAAAARGRQ